MLKEFALDPNLLGNWRDFRFFVGQFGAAQGRLISRFPKDWKRMVFDAAQSAEEVEHARIEEALSRIDRVMLIRDYDYEKAHEWIRNAAKENEKRPFHSIVSTKNHSNQTNLLIGDDIDPTAPPELWIVPTSIHIERKPEAMAQCVETLLSQCKEAIFVDPYFDPARWQYLAPLWKFLAAIKSRETRSPPIRLEYHTGNQNKDTATFQTNLETRVQPHLPSGVKLKVIRWDKAGMHNRYVLTDRGGVMFGHGLDCDQRHPIGYDTVSLLDDATCQHLMESYAEGSTAVPGKHEIFIAVG